MRENRRPMVDGRRSQFPSVCNTSAEHSAEATDWSRPRDFRRISLEWQCYSGRTRGVGTFFTLDTNVYIYIVIQCHLKCWVLSWKRRNHSVCNYCCVKVLKFNRKTFIFTFLCVLLNFNALVHKIRVYLLPYWKLQFSVWFCDVEKQVFYHFGLENIYFRAK